MTNEEARWILKFHRPDRPRSTDRRRLQKAIDVILDEGKWIITGEEQGAFGITYKIRKCNKCGWEHSLVIPDNFCPNCGADMQKGGAKND